ncbi:ferroxidase fet3 [Coemansia sp. RSA 2708]|nr:ferroxidase fet3 [Coemansia sp. RSA 2708]
MHLAALTVFVGLAAARRLDVSWNVGYVQVNRDGHSMRTAIGVNGALPVAPIYADQGDTLYLHVHNSLNKTTSIHAHGILQTGSNFMDGAAMVTQCGIPPGDSFTYQVVLNQTGTFWIHGHDHDELADGLRAPLIIRDAAPPYQYDGEYVLAFEDWYTAMFDERMDETLDPTKPFPPPPSFPYALINGVNANYTETMRFAADSVYRVRLVNMATTEWFKFSMPGHEMHVIEADGVYSDPFLTDGLTIAPGQRYSVLVRAHASDRLNYQYLVEIYASFIPRLAGLNPRYHAGLIEYQKDAPLVGSDKEELLDQLPEDVPLAWNWDIELKALSRQPVLPVTRQIEIVIGGALFSDGITRDLINNVSYVPPKVPTLYSALSLGDLANNASLYGPNSNVIVIDHMEYVELLIQNPSRLPHPIHLHMTTFQVVEYGPASDDVIISQGATPPKIPAPVRSFDRWPMERDTIVVPPMQYAKVRFHAQDGFVAYGHCHLQVHLRMGMAFTLVVAPDVMQKTMTIPPSMYELCRKQGIPITGNAAGNPGADMSGLPQEPFIVSH